uniref:Uncharacterized protein n=1 Tax=Fagus sylvatica TaxID=28930 RepID=A0A2N9G1D0_FAGSY
MAEEASKLRGLEARVAALEMKLNFLQQFMRRMTKRVEEKKKAMISERQKEIHPTLGLSKAAQTLPTPKKASLPYDYACRPEDAHRTTTQRVQQGPDLRVPSRRSQGTWSRIAEVLRHRIQDLLDQGVLKFRVEGIVNTIGAEKNDGIDITSAKIPWEPLTTPRAQKELAEAGIKEDFEEFCEKKKEELGKLSPATPPEMSKPNPVVIQYAAKEKIMLQTASVSTVQSSEKVPSVVIQVPRTFPLPRQQEDSLELWDERRLLLKVLNEAYVPEDITGPSFENMVTSILVTNQLTFSDDELPPEGRGHTKALYISVKTNNLIVSKVLIDNGSALNVCPMTTLEKLDIDPTHVRATSMVVRAFDGTRREVIGEIELPIEIGLQVYDINFQVLRIDSPYNLLLGRPWLAYRWSNTLFPTPKDELKNSSRRDFEPGQGLGCANQGRTAIVALEGNKDRYGLGYTPTRRDRQFAYEARRRRAAARLRGEKWPEEKMIIPHIRTTFPASAMFQVDGSDEDELALLFAEDLSIDAITVEEDSTTPLIYPSQYGRVDLEDFLEEEDLKGYHIEEETFDEDTGKGIDFPNLFPHLMMPCGLETLEFEMFCEHEDPESHLQRNIANWKDLAEAFLDRYRYKVKTQPPVGNLSNSTTTADGEAHADPLLRGLSIDAISDLPLPPEGDVGRCAISTAYPK